MGMVKVVNANQYEHRENFKGDMITIPAGGFVEMDREDAVLFKSQFTVPKFGKDKLQTPESYKMLRLIPIESDVPEPKKENEFTCMACGFEAKSNAGLSAHIRATHKSAMLDEDAKKELEI